MAHDATELELPAASFDVVFSNWLLMYLSDEEVSKLAADALCWVRTPLPTLALHVSFKRGGSMLAADALCWRHVLLPHLCGASGIVESGLCPTGLRR